MWPPQLLVARKDDEQARPSGIVGSSWGSHEEASGILWNSGVEGVISRGLPKPPEALYISNDSKSITWILGLTF